MTVIGDNVDIGAHSCIIGDINIGHNVTIGAMTFVNKDVPDNSIIYNPVTSVIKPNNFRKRSQPRPFFAPGLLLTYAGHDEQLQSLDC